MPAQTELNDHVNRILTVTEASDSGQVHANLPISTVPWHQPSIMKHIRHLRVDLYLPDPYNRRLWTDELLKQLTNLTNSTVNGKKLKDMRVLIATWHRFRELTEWQAEILELLGQFSVRGHTQVRTRSLDGKLRAGLQSLDLTARLRDVTMASTPNVFIDCCEATANGMDWEWEGGVVI